MGRTYIKSQKSFLSFLSYSIIFSVSVRAAAVCCKTVFAQHVCNDYFHYGLLNLFSQDTVKHKPPQATCLQFNTWFYRDAFKKVSNAFGFHEHIGQLNKPGHIPFIPVLGDICSWQEALKYV